MKTKRHCAHLLWMILMLLPVRGWAQSSVPPTVSMTLRVKVPSNTPVNDKIWIWSGMTFAVNVVHTPFTLVSGTTDTWQATVSAPQGTIFRYFYNRNDSFGVRERYADYDSSPSSLLSPFHFREVVVTSGATVNDVIALWTDTTLLDHTTGTITGRVTDEQGKPLTGILVTAGPMRRETNTEGVYWIPGVPAGPGYVTFHAENGEYRATTVAAEFPADGTVTKDIALTTAVMSTLTFNVTVPSDTPTDAKVRIYGDTFRLGMADTQYSNFVDSTQMIDMAPAGVNRWTYTVQVGSGTCLNYIYTVGHYAKNNERAGGGAIVTRPICFSGDATFNDTVAAWKTPQQVPVTLNLQSPTSEVEFYVTTSDVNGGFSLLRMWSTGPNTAKFVIYANANTTLSYRYQRGDRDPDVTLGDSRTPIYRTIAVGSSGAASTDTVQWRGQMMEPALTTVSTGITRPVSVRSAATPFQSGIFLTDYWVRPLVPLVAPSVQRIKSKNAQWVRVFSHRILSDGNSGPRLDRGGVSTPDQDLVRYIRQAKAVGLNVDLRSDLAANSFAGIHTIAWIDQFFGEFQSYLLHDAKIAQQEGVEILEVKSTGWPNETSATKAYINAKYKALIAAVRASGYTGKLESEKVNAQPEFDWYADLDYLAGPISFPAGITATDSVQALYDAAISQLNSTFLPLSIRFHKPFILTLNFNSTNLSATGFYNQDTDVGHLVPNNPAILSSYDAQARAYQAMALAAAGMPWIQGVFAFGYAYWDMDAHSVSIRSKTAEEILSQIYQQVQANTLSANCSYSLSSGGQMIPAAGG
ncbi:MAG: carboxypeptidase regulatory-like domain-containing protein, partial [Bryobacteraceae bacterium]